MDGIDQMLFDDLREQHDALSRDGFRVLALAYRDFAPRHVYTKDDESDLTLVGYAAFLDPPKETAKAAIAALGGRGVAVKILTGDNELVSRKICQAVGLATRGPARQPGREDERCRARHRRGDDAVRAHGAAQKQRVIEVLQHAGHVVGFLGDGITTAGCASPTSHRRHRGRRRAEAADIILLERPLVVEEASSRAQGVLQHHQVRAHGRELEPATCSAYSARARCRSCRCAAADPDQQSVRLRRCRS